MVQLGRMKKTEKVLEYTIVFEPAQEGGYVVYVPSLPSCHSQGETKQEARQHIIEAIALYLEELKRQGKPITHEQDDLVSKVRVRI
ncbi:MAG: type II toxin-antitoxin system HicB family antitoxin [Patescibacteria group bacterium]